MTDVRKRFNVQISGQGQQYMLFAHGFGCDQNMWRFITPAFEKHFKLVLFDYLGHGQSDSTAYTPERYSNLQGYAEDVLEICRALNIRKAIFVGHSVSAMIGALAAIKQPEVFEKLIMVGPSPCYINQGEYVGGFSRADIDSLIDSLESNYLGWSSVMAPVIMGRPDQPALGEELTNSFCRTNPEIARQFAQVTFFSDNREDLLKLTLPTLVLQCSEDVIAPLEVGAYVAEKVANSTLVVLETAGHCPHLSAPEETIAAIQPFLHLN
ncbi:alpha/beta fold hydrolase [Cesiribacter andamanensis]|uniref:Sigma factor sigB regulation protein rsbQ n=1 Tax=Cesiribacter andamanensis AMV16 TaxID=1279009 RepID=M7NY36_9BACT|nr:Sigma factor sigB regulation protein rsbQ [Cesiribacter andamanensis AMV16]